MRCRHCDTDLSLTLIDLGSAPPSNAYLSKQTLCSPEKWYPLKVLVCRQCWLAQTADYTGADELFSADYAYFSSFSTSWLQHAEYYVTAMTERFGLNNASFVIEIAANDGYLLQYVKARGIPCLGIEPTACTAAAARAKGVEIIDAFFGTQLALQLASQGMKADLTVANNVLAHVPDINDFVSGFALLLKPAGVATFEFPHLMKLVKENQFDTIYHEHFSYLSLTSVIRIFESNGLSIFDVEELPTHGGSLRVFAQRKDTISHEIRPSIYEILKREETIGMRTSAYYAGLQEQADKLKYDFISFLIEAKRGDKKIIAYGAAAKGNTLLNYAGIRQDLIPCVVDRNTAKQGKFLPGSRIPIYDDSCIFKQRPDYVVILPWNLSNEVIEQLDYIREWGGRFVTAIPSLKII